MLVFRNLFSSFFSADEWFHFTQYLPLTTKPEGFLTAILSPFTQTNALSGGQHINPIATVIFFLNTKFFGMNYAPYAFMSLLVHAINSFLIFYFIQLYLPRKVKYFVFALLGGMFFTLAPNHIHTFTGAAPFYGENLLSATWVLLSIIMMKFAFGKKQKKYIYISLLFLLFALFSKETSGYLLLFLPAIIFFEKRVFSLKFLSNLFIIFIIIYVGIRFLIPTIFQGENNVQEIETKDTGTIVSRDLSIHENLPAELLLRSITFPLRTMGTVYVSRPAVETIAQVIAPIVVPQPSVGDHASQVQFVNSAGNFLVVYIIGISLFLFFIIQSKQYAKKREKETTHLILLGIIFIILSSLPLVAIIFSFPRWGYDAYFDSRHNYHPTIGASLLFPFLLVGIAWGLSRLLRIKSMIVVFCLVFIIWLTYNMVTVTKTFDQFVNRYDSDRREVLMQIKEQLPVLPQKTVLYIETDGKSPYGPILPFQTGVAQAVSVFYFDTNPLPDGFYNKPILNGKPEGYQYEDDRGFGYYTSKKSLGEALVEKQFAIDDIYGFYYEAEKVILNNTTPGLRKEMQEYLEKRKEFSDWKQFIASPSATETVTFFHPPDSEIIEIPLATTEAKLLKDIRIHELNASLKIIRVLSTSDMLEILEVVGEINDAESQPMPKKFIFDTYHSNDGYTLTVQGTNYSFIKFDDVLITYTTESNPSAVDKEERIMGSLIVEEKK